MKEFLKGLFAVGTMTFVLVGCTSSPKHNTSGTQPGQRIHIPQEQVTLDRAIQPKVMPMSSLCGLGETAQNALKSAMKIFPDTFKIKN